MAKRCYRLRITAIASALQPQMFIADQKYTNLEYFIRLIKSLSVRYLHFMHQIITCEAGILLKM
jgi:hypothetical protein